MKSENDPPLPEPELAYLLNQSFVPENMSASSRRLFDPNNPAKGQSAVASLVARDYRGGIIREAAFPPACDPRIPFYNHYWNVVDGKAEDYTKSQFPPDFPHEDFLSGKAGWGYLVDATQTLLNKKHAVSGYKLLKAGVEELLQANPIFLDPKFQRCWELAFAGGSVCSKLRFACLVYDGAEPVVETVNASLTAQFGQGRYCSLDGNECIRRTLAHRQEPALGDCGHAPIWALKALFEKGYKPSDLKRLDFYEAGFYPETFAPWERQTPSYSCVGCENAFALYDLPHIWGVYQGKWTKFELGDSLYKDANNLLS